MAIPRLKAKEKGFIKSSLFLQTTFTKEKNMPDLTSFLYDSTNVESVQDNIENLENLENLNQKHLTELKNSGICDSIIKLNFSSHYGEETRELLLSEAVSKLGEGKQSPHVFQFVTTEVQRLFGLYHHLEKGGWWCAGLDPFKNWDRMEWGCFKPDHPRSDIMRGKLIKYEHPPKTATRAFFLDVSKDIWDTISTRNNIPIGDEPTFWGWVKNNNVPIAITEGAKKAAALLTCGVAAIALPGINSGYRKVDDNNKILIPELEIIASRNRKVIIAFDQDVKFETVKAVRTAIKGLGGLLTDKGCKVAIAQWNNAYKGIDDLLVATDTVTVSRAIEESQPFDDYLEENKGRLTRPTADVVAKEIYLEYKDTMVYSDTNKSWYVYQHELPGVWSPISQECLEAIIHRVLESKGIKNIGDYAYISNISKFLRGLLIKIKWEEISSSEYLPFKNGVLELRSGKLNAHSPYNYLTWQLPREHDPSASDWSQINKFLDHLSGNDPEVKAILLCYCNAVLKGRYDLQKFLHLIGLGGTGKGTYSRLIVSLIGERNVCSSTLHDFCTNVFDGYNAYGKRLVLFAEEDTALNRIGKFLSLTGEDPLRAEAKGQKAFNFRYQGMTLVCSNMPVFTGQAASRVKRRVITVPCNNRVKSPSNLEKKFEGELAAFTNYVLSLSDTYVSEILRGESSTQCALEFWENRIRVDSLASWLNDWVIFDPNAITSIGGDKNEGDNGSRINTLFGSYSLHCRQNAGQQQSSRNFSPNLLELCGTVLGWEVQVSRKSTGRFITGLRLREPGIDDSIPTYEMILEQKNYRQVQVQAPIVEIAQVEAPQQAVIVETVQLEAQAQAPIVEIAQVEAPQQAPTVETVQLEAQVETRQQDLNELIVVVRMSLQDGDALHKYELAKECFDICDDKQKKELFAMLSAEEKNIFREGKKLFDSKPAKTNTTDVNSVGDDTGKKIRETVQDRVSWKQEEDTQISEIQKVLTQGTVLDHKYWSERIDTLSIRVKKLVQKWISSTFEQDRDIKDIWCIN